MENRIRGVAIAGALLAVTITGAHTALAGVPASNLAVQAQPGDDTLKERITYRLDTNPVVRKYDVKVAVDSGIATLSGTVATQTQKDEAERIADIDGVARVESNIAVDPDVDRTLADRLKDGFSKTGEKISDAWITAKVNWFFVGEDLLKGSDIDVDTRDNVVTLKGHVRSQEGRARALELARHTEGVRQVVDELAVRTSAQ